MTYCRIALLDPRGDQLTTFTAFPLRSIGDWNPAVGESHRLDDLFLHRQAVRSMPPVIFREEEGTAWLGIERQLVFFEGMKSACILPLSAEGSVLGTITVGEARAWEREPLDERKLVLLQTL